MACITQDARAPRLAASTTRIQRRSAPWNGVTGSTIRGKGQRMRSIGPRWSMTEMSCGFDFMQCHGHSPNPAHIDREAR